MQLQILTPDDAEWDDAIASCVVHDVHFSAAYAKANEGQHRALLAVAQVGHLASRLVAKPFLHRKIEGTPYTDVTSLYGYGGPISSYSQHGAIEVAHGKTFETLFAEWCRSASVVSEFCIFHPLLAEWQAPLVGGLPPVRKRVAVIDIDWPDEDLLGSMRPDKRQNIARAQRRGVVIDRSDYPTYQEVQIFHRLYNETMDRRGAAARWRLPLTYFTDHVRCGATLFFATVDGKIEVASIILTSPPFAYYHFTGNALSYPRSGANDLLIYEVMRWARSQNCERLHLGGGATDAPDDPLLAYKSGFGDGRADVRVLLTIHDRAVYDLLSDEAQKRRGATTTFLPAYRSEEAA